MCVVLLLSDSHPSLPGSCAVLSHSCAVHSLIMSFVDHDLSCLVRTVCLRWRVNVVVAFGVTADQSSDRGSRG